MGMKIDPNGMAHLGVDEQQHKQPKEKEKNSQP